jgi:hypothetical protein
VGVWPVEGVWLGVGKAPISSALYTRTTPGTCCTTLSIRFCSSAVGTKPTIRTAPSRRMKCTSGPPAVVLACDVPNTVVRIWISNLRSPSESAWSRLRAEPFVAMIRLVNPGSEVGVTFVTAICPGGSCPGGIPGLSVGGGVPAAPGLVGPVGVPGLSVGGGVPAAPGVVGPVGVLGLSVGGGVPAAPGVVGPVGVPGGFVPLVCEYPLEASIATESKMMIRFNFMLFFSICACGQMPLPSINS